MATQCGSLIVADMVVKADFPHSHTDPARGKERGVVHVPHSPFHEAQGSTGEDPSNRGDSKTCHLAVSAIDEQKHGGHTPRELQKNTEHCDGGALGLGTTPVGTQSYI